MEGREGLDYAGVERIMRLASGRRSGFRPRDERRLWQEVRTLEIGALKAWSDERKKRQNRN